MDIEIKCDEVKIISEKDGKIKLLITGAEVEDVEKVAADYWRYYYELHGYPVPHNGES